MQWLPWGLHMGLRHSDRPGLALASRWWLQEDKIAVIVATTTDDARLFDVPKLRVCALKFTETARARIVKVSGRLAGCFGGALGVMEQLRLLVRRRQCRASAAGRTATWWRASTARVQVAVAQARQWSRTAAQRGAAGCSSTSQPAPAAAQATAEQSCGSERMLAMVLKHGARSSPASAPGSSGRRMCSSGASVVCWFGRGVGSSSDVRCPVRVVLTHTT